MRRPLHQVRRYNIHRVLQSQRGGHHRRLFLIPAAKESDLVRKNIDYRDGCYKDNRFLYNGLMETTKKKHGNATHGMSGSREYTAYRSMLARCNIPSLKSYPRYGGRGIKVCERWTGKGGFENFFSDMGVRPSVNHSLERRDNDGNYCPANCYWATCVEQNRNTRRNRLITVNGVTATAAEWGEKTGINPMRIISRLHRGWSDEDSVTVDPGRTDRYTNGKSNRRVTLDGKTMTLSQWARKIGISKNSLSYRLKVMSVHKAINKPPQKRKQKPHE